MRAVSARPPLTQAEADAQPRPTRYYESLVPPQGADALLRCKDCQRLVSHAVLQHIGCCPCGNRRVAEITTLSLWEHFKIARGMLVFPHREKFLKEFVLTVWFVWVRQ